MQTRLPPDTLATATGAEADAILRRCVHCGFCNATCPTYGLTGNELESPRGRIYLIKSLLEGEAVSEASLGHLDHCLGCRACETTCPSGVRFHRLADIGREILDERGTRPDGDLRRRRLLARFFDGSALFRGLVGLGRLFRPLLPARLRRQLPPGSSGPAPAAGGARAVMLQEGCVQPTLTPATNRAAARVLARRGIGATPADGCCGALAYHLGDVERARAQVRRNIDRWHPGLANSEGLVVTASGCAAFIRDYGSLCAGDDAYASRAAELAEGVRDVADFLTPMRGADGPAVALHLPCTLRHALKGAERLRSLLAESGWRLVETGDDGQCCGSAGAYSLFYPATAGALRDKKVTQLSAGGPAEIVTANVGCRLHLAAASPVPVRHWIELWDELEAAEGHDAAPSGPASRA
jgi:glycolate oxidase iron-sulfur subunit